VRFEEAQAKNRKETGNKERSIEENIETNYMIIRNTISWHSSVSNIV
jgi:hypothetical protein